MATNEATNKEATEAKTISTEESARAFLSGALSEPQYNALSDIIKKAGADVLGEKLEALFEQFRKAKVKDFPAILNAVAVIFKYREQSAKERLKITTATIKPYLQAAQAQAALQKIRLFHIGQQVTFVREDVTEKGRKYVLDEGYVLSISLSGIVVSLDLEDPKGTKYSPSLDFTYPTDAKDHDAVVANFVRDALAIDGVKADEHGYIIEEEAPAPKGGKNKPAPVSDEAETADDGEESVTVAEVEPAPAKGGRRAKLRDAA